MQEQEPFDPPAGMAEHLGPRLRRILAPNPSPMTYRGTNTYLVGSRDIAVIDPGPSDPRHLEAILAAVPPGARIAAILVTHAHLDHSPLAAPLSARCGAPVLAFGDADAGRSAVMQRLAATGSVGGGEGVDAGFAPDRRLVDGEVIETGEVCLRAIHTPGHFGNHLSFAFEDCVFTGDVVMGWASSLISPPDGDLADFRASCQRLASHEARVFHPGHGAPVSAPQERLDWLLAHRAQREEDILAALAAGPASAADLAARIYTETPVALLPAAARNVLAHLIDLSERAHAAPLGPLAPDSRFTLS